MAAQDPVLAAGHFGLAGSRLQELEMPLESAPVRLSLATALAAQGDFDGAELQLATVKRIFTQAQALYYLKQCETVLVEITPPR